MQGERYFCSNCQQCSKNLSSKYLKGICEGIDFSQSCRLEIFTALQKMRQFTGVLQGFWLHSLPPPSPPPPHYALTIHYCQPALGPEKIMQNYILSLKS